MKTTFVATGDSFITRHIPEEGYPGYQELSDLIWNHDVRFANLEMTFHNSEGSPAAESGGTWAMTDPSMLDDMLGFGFNLFNTANNHSGDFGEGGTMATIRHLRERGMIFAGTGPTLQEAAHAAYLETPGARVALIGLSSTCSKSSIAGGQGLDMRGRPGLNPLRFRTVHHLNAKHFAMAKELAEVTLVNAQKEYSISTGYTPPFAEGTMPLGSMSLVLNAKASDKEWNETIPNAADLERTVSEIREAKRQADIVLVSIHTHEMRARKTNEPPLFLERFAHACIDAGATAVIGHGPHEMRGIEVYKGGLIFYSVGNFIFETETVARQPWDAYAKHGLPVDTGVGAYMDHRSCNGTRGYVVLENIWRAIVPEWTVEDGRVKDVILHPIELGQTAPRSQRGVPVLSTGDKAKAALEYLRELSKPYGTKITIRGGVGRVAMG
ncbi:MAG: CapA family protein [Mesosutterella sp.]|nr:CapA family protein [Mesosutterella sp.]